MSDELATKLAEEVGSLKMRLTLLTDACRVMLDTAAASDGAPSAGMWKAFREDVLRVGSKVTALDLKDDMIRALSRV